MTKKQPKKNSRPGVDGLGRTPLHYAAAQGHLDEVASMLKSGANMNARDDNGWTPLHFAAQASMAKAALLLLQAGAEIEATDSNGNTPLSNAVFSCRGDGEMIRLLRERGADPLRENHHGVSPVSLAREIASHDVAQFFSDLSE